MKDHLCAFRVNNFLEFGCQRHWSVSGLHPDNSQVCVCVCVYACVCVYICVCEGMCVCMYVWLCIHTRTCVCVSYCGVCYSPGCPLASADTLRDAGV